MKGGRALLALALWLAGPGAGVARAADGAGTQSPFVLGSGARALGMGRAAAALADDATALYWNPARLTRVERGELSLFRTKLFVDGVNYHAGFLSYPTLDLGTFGVGYQRLDVSDIERRDARNALLGTFNEAESNLMFGYGRQVSSLASLGATLRLAQQSVDGNSDLAVGLDLGLALERPLGAAAAHTVGLGAMVQNAVEPTLRLDQEDVKDPRSLKLGVGYQGAPPSGNFAWALGADLDLPSQADARVGVGAEVSYDHLLALRAGQDAGHLTLGFGLAYAGVRLDYAMRADDELSRNDRFSLAVRFGLPVSDRRAVRRAQREREVADQLAALLAQREQQEREHALQEADAAFAAQHFDEAARYYRRLLALAPDDPQVRTRVDAFEHELALAQAASAFDAGESARAAAAYQAVLDHWPQDERAQQGLASARRKLQESADREAQLSSLLKDALARFADGEFHAAENALRELLRVDPKHQLGRELLDRVVAARLAAAEREAQAAARLQAQALAQRQAQAQHPQPATAAAPVAARRPALSSEQRRTLERQYREGLDAFGASDFERAIRLWREVWLEAPDYESVAGYLVKAYLLEGIALYSSGQYDEAMERCQRVLEIEPGNAKAQRYLARIQEEKVELEQIGSR